MNHRRHKTKKTANINIVPYVDLMLLLVVILAISCAGILPSIVDLPSLAQKKQSASQMQQATIWVKSNGSYAFSWNKEQATEMPFAKILQDIQSKKNEIDVRILIAGDKKTPYENMVNTMSKLKKNGIEEVSLLLKSKD